LPYVLPIAEPSVSALPATQPIPDSVPEDVKLLLQKFPSILHTGDLMPIPTHGVEHHIHTGSHPPVFAKYRRLVSEKHEIAKAEFKCLESASTVRCSKSSWASHLHMVPKKWILATLWRLTLSQFGYNPSQVPLAKYTGPFKPSAWLQNFFKNLSCHGSSPNSCCSHRHPKSGDYHTIWLVLVLDHAVWAV
jgi:hypothetical protein